jgi:hypothetical protein
LQLEVAIAEERNEGEDVEARHEDGKAGVPSSEVVRKPKGKEVVEGANDGKGLEVRGSDEISRCFKHFGFVVIFYI